MSNLILCGLKNAGKTTFGKTLSQVLHKPFIDTDALFGDSRELYERLGEKKFREIERDAIQKIQVQHHVIALGGGALLCEENRHHLRSLGTIVYIHLEKEDWLSRVAGYDSPIFRPSKEEYYQLRVEICRAAAHLEISHGNKFFWA